MRRPQFSVLALVAGAALVVVCLHQVVAQPVATHMIEQDPKTKNGIRLTSLDASTATAKRLAWDPTRSCPAYHTGTEWLHLCTPGYGADGGEWTYQVKDGGSTGTNQVLYPTRDPTNENVLIGSLNIEWPAGKLDVRGGSEYTVEAWDDNNCTSEGCSPEPGWNGSLSVFPHLALTHNGTSPRGGDVVVLGRTTGVSGASDAFFPTFAMGTTAGSGSTWAIDAASGRLAYWYLATRDAADHLITRILVDGDTYATKVTIGPNGLGDTGVNTLGVNGTLAVGAGYMTTTAPSGGAIISGSVGIGETNPGGKLSVSGSLGVGASYDTTAPPSNGAIIEGRVGIGTSSPSALAQLDVVGALRVEGIGTFIGDVGLTNTGTASQLSLYEPSGSGGNYQSFEAVAQTANIENKLPTSIGAPGDILCAISASAPSIQWAWCSSTGTGTVGYWTRSSSGGGYLYPTTTTDKILSGSSGTPTTQIDAWTSGASGISSYAFSTLNNTFAGSPYLFLQRSRNASLGTVTQTIANDWLGTINWRGVGSNNVSYSAAQIRVVQDGASGAAEWTIPSDMIFSTSNGTTDVDVMTISSDSRVGIGTSAPATMLHVHAGTLRLTAASDATQPNEISANAGATGLLYTGKGTHQFVTDSDTIDPGNDGFFVYRSNVSTTPHLSVLATSGRVGVGTGSPLRTLHLVKADIEPLLLVEGTVATGYSQIGFQGTGRRYQMGVGNAGEVALGVADQWFLFDSGVAALRMAMNTSGQLRILSLAASLPVCTDGSSNLTTSGCAALTTVPFSNITSGTNTVAAMLVGTGSSLNFTGTGTINASSLQGATWAAPLAIGSTTPAAGTFTTLAVNSTATLSAAVKVARTTTATSYTVVAGDYYVGVTSTAAPRTITLEAAATAGAGRVLIIKDESGGAATNNITVDASGAETIDGATTYVMTNDYESISLLCTGTAWFIF